MKKHLTGIVVFTWLLQAADPSIAQTPITNAATISVGVIRAIPGSAVSLPLTLSHTGSVAALQYDLSYNPSKMTVGYFQSGIISNNLILRSRQIAPGVQRVLAYNSSLALLRTNTVIGDLQFTVPVGQLTGGGRITISNATASSLSATSVNPIRLRHGAVLVEPVSRGPDGVVDLFLIVQSNRTYLVQATTNFVNWVNISTNFATYNYVVAQDSEAVNYSSRFYRAVVVDAGVGGAIMNVNMSGSNQMTFGYATTAGKTYILQASTNLAGWDNLTTNLAAGALLNFTNFISPAMPKQFFRIMEMP